MSYNLKNKIVVMFAVAFSLVLANNVKAQEAEVADVTPPSAEQIQPTAEVEQANVTDDDPFGLDDPLSDSLDPLEDEFEDTKSAEVAKEAKGPNVVPSAKPSEQPLPKNQKQNVVQPQKNTNNPKKPEENVPDVNLDNSLPEISIDEEAPKTPFEKYGNTILSRVDNDLFNQMSEIEKQTTLLNLELKREEVKNRIDALKAQRERAKQEELDRAAQREKQARDEELQRQKALLQEQMRLKEKEMELEKIRQAKIISEYMNEMLITNQQWVETNAKLSTQIKNLQDERVKLIAEIENKLEDLNKRANITGQLAEETRVAYERQISTLNKQIEGLKKIISDKDNALQNMAKGDNNPFADSEVIDEDAVDMSKEYAIMDITGRGDNIVAKIVSQDGTTFTVRKGSVLKGGEVVVNISDKFITFENHGVRSYLYTGGTVMQYEPTESFNDAPKTPEVAQVAPVKTQEIRNVRGAGSSNNNAGTLKNEVKKVVQPEAPKTKDTKKTSSVSSGSSGKGVASFSQGMMVK